MQLKSATWFIAIIRLKANPKYAVRAQALPAPARMPPDISARTHASIWVTSGLSGDRLIGNLFLRESKTMDITRMGWKLAAT